MANKNDITKLSGCPIPTCNGLVNCKYDHDGYINLIYCKRCGMSAATERLWNSLLRYPVCSKERVELLLKIEEAARELLGYNGGLDCIGVVDSKIYATKYVELKKLLDVNLTASKIKDDEQ